MPLIKHTTAIASNATADVFVKSEPVKAETPVVDKKMSNADWAAKDRRISRQGLFQAALQSPAIMQYAPTLEEYLELVKKVADVGLAYVNEVTQ